MRIPGMRDECAEEEGGLLLVVENIDEIVVVGGLCIRRPLSGFPQLWGCQGLGAAAGAKGFLGCLGKHWFDGSMLDCFRLCSQRPLFVIFIVPHQLFIDISFVFDRVELAISLILRVPWLKVRVSVPECKGAADVVGLEVNTILVVEGY